jgi:hypothetical protein
MIFFGPDPIPGNGWNKLGQFKWESLFVHLKIDLGAAGKNISFLLLTLVRNRNASKCSE